MALFSIFGKKTAQTDGSPADTAREAPPAAADSTAVREQAGQRAQRELARITSEKIDAIESEIARDILKAPQPKGGKPAAADASEKPDDSISTELFHTTLIRVDKETMILFKEDMDE